MSTPLFRAVLRNNVEIIKLLVESGARNQLNGKIIKDYAKCLKVTGGGGNLDCLGTYYPTTQKKVSFDRPTYKMEGKNWYIYFSTDVKNGEWRIGTKENMASKGKYYTWYLEREVHPLHPDGSHWKRPNRSTTYEKQLHVESIG